MNALASAFAFQQSRASPAQHANANSITVAAALIQHDDRLPPRLQHAMNLSHCGVNVRRGLEHPVAISASLNFVPHGWVCQKARTRCLRSSLSSLLFPFSTGMTEVQAFAGTV